MGFISANVGRLMGSTSTALAGAQALLAGESQGLAFDFTDSSAYIIDTGTPANNYSSTGIVSSGSLVGPSGKLTYTSPSNKLTMQSDGFIKYQAHNILQYSSLDGVSAGSPGTAPTGWTWFSSGTVTNSALSNDAITFTIESGARVFAYRAQTGVIGQTYCFAAYVTIDSGTVTPADILAVVSTTPINTSFTYQGSSTTSSTALSGSGWLVYRFDASVSATITCRFGLGATSAGSGAQGVTVSKPHLYRYPANTDYIKTTSAAKYALPIEYDTSGNCLGLLVEEARTNLITYGTDIGNSSGWQTTSLNASVASSPVTSPSGLTDAFRLTEDSSAATFHRMATLVMTVSASTAYTLSCYMKAGTRSYGGLRYFNNATSSAAVLYDLTDGTVADTGVAGSAAITSHGADFVGNGWYRIWMTLTTVVNTSYQANILINDDGSLDGGTLGSHDGDGSSYIDIWCPQLEAGSVTTSPIITYGATATRAADNISIATSLTPYSATENTILMSFTDDKNLGSNNPWLEISPASRANGLTQIYTSSGSITARYYGPSFASQCLFTDAYASETAITKVGISLKANLFDCSINGSTEAQDTAGTYQTNADTNIALGNQSGGAVQCNGIIRYLCIKPRTSSATEIRTETA